MGRFHPEYCKHDKMIWGGSFFDDEEVEGCEQCDRESMEGVFCSNYCPRGRADCQSLSQIVAADHASFICVGRNDGSTRAMEQDEFRECFVNDEIDRMEDADRRDLQHAAAVFSMALAVLSSDADRQEPK